jgi:hypothetical protein
MADIQKSAAKKGGVCLSEKYVDTHEDLLWRCAVGHDWRANPNSIRSGRWCPVCGRNRTAQSRRAHTIEEMQQLAKSKGGVCLSQVYLSSSKKLHWRCAKDHEWKTIPKLVIKGSWCPLCARIRAQISS